MCNFSDNTSNKATSIFIQFNMNFVETDFVPDC